MSRVVLAGASGEELILRVKEATDGDVAMRARSS